MKSLKALVVSFVLLMLTTVHIQAQQVNPKSILQTLQSFYIKFPGGEELVRKAEGYLVFPQI